MDKRKKINEGLVGMVWGKVPPQARDLEEKILGIMIMEYASIPEVMELIKPSDFYVTANGIICKVIFEISREFKPEISIIVEELRKLDKLEEVGGVFAIVKLTNNVVGSINLKEYCKVVKQKSIMRRLIGFSQEIVTNAFEETTDIFDLLSTAENELKGINFELEEMKIVPLSSVAMNVIDKFDNKVFNAKNNIIDENDVHTGFKDWDAINGSLFPALFVIAGRPGMGKGVHMTELACRIGRNTNVGIINAEMTNEQLLLRIGCNLLNIGNELFKKDPKLVTEKEQESLHEAMNEAIQLKLHLESSRNIHKIANKIRLWVEKYDVKVVLADFLTLFKVPQELEKYYTKTAQVDYILDIFTQLCRDLKIPIILYVQMNREILGRAGTKEPNLADLKQSGSIEELAYQVSFLHRPEYYDESATVDEMGESTKGLCYQIIAKHRDGKTGRIKLRANLSCSQMKNWDDLLPVNFNQEEIVNTPF